MSELVTTSKSIGFVFKRASQWVLSKISTYLQQKFFPIDLTKIKVELDDVPNIHCDGENSTIDLRFLVSNFSPYYNYGLISSKCELWIERTKFTTLRKNTYLDLEVGQTEKQYFFASYLGNSEIKRALNIFGDNEFLNCKFDLVISVVTPIGVKKHSIDISNQINLIQHNSSAT